MNVHPEESGGLSIRAAMPSLTRPSGAKIRDVALVVADAALLLAPWPNDR